MEIWQDIKGYRNLYQVSNLGRIRRKDNRKSIKPLHKNNDAIVWLYHDKKGNYDEVSIPYIVCTYFYKNPNGFTHILHRNGIEHDNKLVNLEWVNDTLRKRKPCTDKSLRLLPFLVDEGLSASILAVIYNVEQSYMKRIFNGEIYQYLHLDIKYNNPNKKHNKLNKKKKKIPSIPKDLYEQLNSSLKDNTVLNILVRDDYLRIQCNAQS